jgi:hypothetical protein
MKKFVLSVATGVVLLASAPVALATPRADSYYEVWCTDADGNLVQAESVDAHAIEQGGKANAIELFSRNYPFGWTCWAMGPFSS